MRPPGPDNFHTRIASPQAAILPLNWKYERNTCPAPEVLSISRRPAVGLGDGAADGQAQSGAIGLGASGRIDAIEAVEDVGQVLGRDADPGVSDGDPDLTVRWLASYGHRDRRVACT